MVITAPVISSSWGMYSSHFAFGTAQTSDRCSSIRKCGQTMTLNASAMCATFSQGVMLAKPFKMILTSYHMIDTNYDGRADIWVNPDTDLDQDGFVEQGVFAWLHDTDFDGGIDRGEYLGPGVSEAMECTEDMIRQRCVTSEDIAKGSTGHLDFANAMMTDINGLLQR